MGLARLDAIRGSKTLICVAFVLSIFTDSSLRYLKVSLTPAVVRGLQFDQCNCSEFSADTGQGNAANATRMYKLINENATFEGRLNGFCRKGNASGCWSKHDVVLHTTPSVGAVIGVSEFAEFIASPAVGVWCSKYGHRTPFLVGAILELISSVGFLLAPNVIALAFASAFQGLSCVIIFVSGLVMVTDVFDPEERGKVISRSFGLTCPIAGIIAYILGSFGYQYFGLVLPMGSVAGLALVDAVVRLLIKPGGRQLEKVAEKSASEVDEETPSIPLSGDDKPVSTADEKDGEQETSYKDLLSDFVLCEVLVVILLVCISCNLIVCTALNRSINVLEAQQWQIGVILGISPCAQLLVAIVTVKILSKRNLWMFVLGTIVWVIVALIVYPLTTTVWWTLVPEVSFRGVALSFAFVYFGNLYHLLLEDRHKHAAAKVFALVKAAAVLGNAIGPFVGYLLQYMSFMVLYYSMAGVLAPSALAAFHIRYVSQKQRGEIKTPE